MLRKRVYSIKGTKVIVRGEIVRKPRVSLICFINADGFMESFMPEGTFNRLIFFGLFERVKSGNIQQYPGKYSIWILDGAKMHCHESIVYSRLCGVIPVFIKVSQVYFYLWLLSQLNFVNMIVVMSFASVDMGPPCASILGSGEMTDTELGFI